MRERRTLSRRTDLGDLAEEIDAWRRASSGKARKSSGAATTPDEPAAPEPRPRRALAD